MRTGCKAWPGTLTIVLASAGLTIASTACGGGRAPILTYKETESPLRYRYATEGGQTADGTASATYLCDPGSGMLLAMQTESRSEGRVFTMGFDLPIEIRSERRAELVR
jgi:hypothetical protein